MTDHETVLQRFYDHVCLYRHWVIDMTDRDTVLLRFYDYVCLQALTWQIVTQFCKGFMIMSIYRHLSLFFHVLGKTVHVGHRLSWSWSYIICVNNNDGEYLCSTLSHTHSHRIFFCTLHSFQYRKKCPQSVHPVATRSQIHTCMYHTLTYTHTHTHTLTHTLSMSLSLFDKMYLITSKQVRF